MKGELFFYCPILGKKVRIESELKNTGKHDFNMSEKKGFCRVGCGICSGNCIGCSLM